MGHDLSRMPPISRLNRIFAACGNAARPRRLVQWRSALGGTAAATIASVIILGAAILPAKAQFTALYGFGYSYADTGAAPGGAFRLAGAPCVYQPNCTFTGSTTFVQSLQSIYAESGDILLTMMVDRQTIDALTGNAGLQLRLPFVAGTALYSPFVNLTAEQDFAGSGRNVTTTLVTAPLLPILTQVSAHDRTYGKVAAGVGATIAENVNATLTASSTFARAGGDAFAVSGGITAAFELTGSLPTGVKPHGYFTSRFWG
jgi:hypothetical protein